ncbi:small multi-drug export protein [Jeotgalibacillus proteolyticus]|uniref:small multi-drug export protein n=1 Tax=Jeotgalibacillus proteolyticus TaxID=2082395 RepID=UPI00142FDCF3|nr:small multi-drug export protein [Jeotgalibacillus proteolyticus]
MENIIAYLSLCFSAWLMGFLPMLEIYVALPASMLMGLDPMSCVFWTALGNFMPIPIILYFYDTLRKWKKASRLLNKMENHRFNRTLIQHGAWMVLLATPIIGSWTVGILGRSLGMSKTKLFVVSLCSICMYSVILVIITMLGVELIKE